MTAAGMLARPVSGGRSGSSWLSNRIFKSFGDIVDHCCYAWSTLIDQPWKIMSIANRDWRVWVTRCLA